MEETKCKYCVIFTCFYFSDKFLLLLPIFKHKYPYFLLFHFQNRPFYFSFNEFEGNYQIFSFSIIARHLPSVTTPISTQLLHMAHGSFATKKVCIWHPGNEAGQSAIFLAHLRTAGTNPTDSTFMLIFCHSFIHLFIYARGSVSFAQNGRYKCPSERYYFL